MDTPSSFSSAFGLFKSALLDKIQESTLCYEATFFPYHLLRERHKIVWHRNLEMKKSELLDWVTEDCSRIYLPESRSKTNAQEWPLCWAFNAQPTETEWNRMTADSRFSIQLRVSGLIPDGGKRAVIVPLWLGFDRAFQSQRTGI
jgi:hypothetical protein